MSNVLYSGSLLFFIASAVATAADREIAKTLTRKLEVQCKFRNAAADDDGNPEACDYVFGNGDLPVFNDAGKEIGRKSIIPPKYAERYPVVNAGGEIIHNPLKVTLTGNGEVVAVEGTDVLAEEIGEAAPLRANTQAASNTGAGGWGAPKS